MPGKWEHYEGWRSLNFSNTISSLPKFAFGHKVGNIWPHIKQTGRVFCSLLLLLLLWFFFFIKFFNILFELYLILSFGMIILPSKLLSAWLCKLWINSFRNMRWVFATFVVALCIRSFNSHIPQRTFCSPKKFINDMSHVLDLWLLRLLLLLFTPCRF